MRGRIHIALGAALCFAGIAFAQQQAPVQEPHIGYIYPAGGCQGTTFRVIVGGQALRGMSKVHVSGEGISANILQQYRIAGRLQAEPKTDLLKMLVDVKNKRLSELPKGVRAPAFPGEAKLDKAVKALEERRAAGQAAAAKPIEHPLLHDLENKSLAELQHISLMLLDQDAIDRKQQNPQLGEAVVIEVTISPEAAPGDRELRLLSLRSITNPMRFVVGTLPEVTELEPNGPNAAPVADNKPLELPVVLNGQVMPGDMDRYSFRAMKGQRLVFETDARELVPFLPDAVPGWFQATLALYDAKGKELAFTDDYQFNPDPVMFFETPADGVYQVEIRDAVYRGREDFVYRLSVGELPFITSMFPLGARTKTKAFADIDGWNLPLKRLDLDTASRGRARRGPNISIREDTEDGSYFVREVAIGGKIPSNAMTYSVDNLSEFMESEPNDDAGHAQRISLPRIVNGRIERPGDSDLFAFVASAGEDVVVEAQARRLKSPLDAVVWVSDASGKVLQWNDDQMLRDTTFLHRDMGTLTHHADPYLSMKIPADGVYYVKICDAQNQGGKAYAYRLRISAPRPDFELRMTPSSLSGRAGQRVPFTVHAIRHDGFSGEIEVFVQDAIDGFMVEGGRIPPQRDSIRMTLAMPESPNPEPFALQLEGVAKIDGAEVWRPVTPCEDVMQAFLYRHLLPSQQLMVVYGRSGRGGLYIARSSDDPVVISAGEAAMVSFKISAREVPEKLTLQLTGAPEWLKIEKVAISINELTFNLKADASAPKAGLRDNAIVEMFTERIIQGKDKDGKDLPPKTVPASLGFLPAIAYVVEE